ncbi:MAG: hypothetical protein A2X94_09675 [Bdellovibrionales bacterium GWB1_55_8]|nr:MAG: hypothetical protein A2X94_09675 [Bdellovibrionales bacterium GWB1_55_8]
MVALSLMVAGCSGKGVDEADPESLFRDAEAEVESSHYQIAIDKFKSVKNKFPYSKFAAESLLRIADVYFLQESFLEAAVSYESFRDLHPKHEKAAYANFRIGKSYFMDIPENVSKDLSSAQKSLAAYNEFIARNPNSEFVKEAREDINRAREMLARKELYVGNFYYTRGHLGAAGPRFKKLIEAYPETQAATEAKQKLARIMGEGN